MKRTLFVAFLSLFVVSVAIAQPAYVPGAATVPYSPATPANWTVVPNAVNAALDTLASNAHGGTPAQTTFTASGTFTPSATGFYLTCGCGGGGGGGGGGTSSVAANGTGGGGGGGAQKKIFLVQISSLAAITVTIGGGGAGNGTFTVSTKASDGNDTTFGSLATFPGGGGGWSGGTSGTALDGPGGVDNRGAPVNLSSGSASANIQAQFLDVGFGQWGGPAQFSQGFNADHSFQAGAQGANPSGAGGHGGGGGGPGAFGAGANGGDGINGDGTGGTVGANAAANTCAGGGGGGGGNRTAVTSGFNGGSGGSGKLLVTGPL